MPSMALLLGSVLPQTPPQIKGAAFSKSLPTQDLKRFCRFERRRSIWLPIAIRAGSSVQQQKGTDRQTQLSTSKSLEFTGVHHVGLLIEDLEKSLDFYQGVLGLELNPERPADKLPYRGAWLWVGEEMIHLMELPNPDPVTGRPAHGGRDRHACVAIKSLDPLKTALEKAGIPFTLSKSGRPAIFARDPDGNALEFAEV